MKSYIRQGVLSLIVGLVALSAVASATTHTAAANPSSLQRITVPAGTVITVRMIDSIDSSRNRSGEEFADMIRNAFDVLYREGETSGRVMAISLHPFLIGTAHTIGAFDAALEYVCGHDGVWLATGSEIIDHYLDSGATF